MSIPQGFEAAIPERQRAIWERCFHRSGAFVEFAREDIEQSIPDRFEHIASTYTDRLAVKDSVCELTYDELNKLANRMARTILAGVEEDSKTVAFLFRAGVAPVVSILAVLKAGKICVPLDPEYPIARLRYMLEDSGASLIVTSDENIALALKMAGETVQIINHDQINPGLSESNLGLKVTPDAPAYIVYTSGSTGEPKGVLQNHRNTLHETMRYTNLLHFCVDDRVGYFNSFSFSAVVRKLYPALLNGASFFPLDVKSYGIHRVVDWMNEQGISIITGSGATIKEFYDTLRGKDALPNLRLITWGSDVMYKRDVELLKEHTGKETILTVSYASTEASGISLYFVDRDAEITENRLPVGYPLIDTEVQILDGEGKPVMNGEVGELAVRSSHLALGYWGKPEATDAAFHSEAGRQRTYLTGDLVRQLPDGCLVHLGRKDFQVKIRGHRVEIPEVEGALCGMENVKWATVLAQGQETGNSRLVAYVVPETPPAPTVTAMRRRLSQVLPDYMVPSAYMILDSLPTTPNDKVDRNALPLPDSTRPQLDIPYVEARTPVEEKLSEIWSEVLGIEQIGVHDNFLDLGGDSLLATQIITRIIKTFQIEISIQALFESPAIAEMSIVITQNLAKEAHQKDIERMLSELEAVANS